MANLRNIEIDFDVHKKIEAERKGFEESPNDVLRRLLDIAAKRPTAVTATPSARRAWSGKGVLLPHGTEIQMDYNGQHYTGVIDDGSWSVEGRKYSSPSDAAGAVGRTKSGGKPSLNGWVYWRVKRPSDLHFIPISSLRPRA